MLDLMEGKLAFVATHRLHWMPDFDYVLVVDGGRIVWQGVPDDLRESRGLGGSQREGGCDETQRGR